MSEHFFLFGKIITRNIVNIEFDMVGGAVVDKIRYRIWRNLAASSRWIIYMMRIGMHYTYFYYELVLWCNSKDSYFKSTNNWITKYMKSFKLSKKPITSKKVNKLEEDQYRYHNFYSGFRHLLHNHHNFSFAGGDPLSRWGTLPPQHQHAFDKVSLPILIGIENTW